VHQLDWGQSIQIGHTTIHCVPAVHFAGRTARDRNETLWCGYVIQSQSRTIYFAADSAIGPHFAAIRERFGPPDLALLPIGAYRPEWFMHPVHMGPADALNVHQTLQAKTSLAIHHGTFQLGDDAPDTPAKVIASLSASESFLVLPNGQSAKIT
jgi:L-ascorbate metabolism protein UlaG (beta-lactamase superfamily)